MDLAATGRALHPLAAGPGAYRRIVARPPRGIAFHGR